MAGFSGSADLGDALASRHLTLAPRFTAARAVRALIDDVLTDTGRAGWADAARLAASEVVTNAALHAHTPIEVTVAVYRDLVRVEVRDFNPVLPTQRHYGTEATTGRGLRLVAALADETGIFPADGGGKVVWFTIADAATTDVSEDALLAAWEMDEAAWADDLVPPPSRTSERTVLLAGMPVALWRAAREHHDALLRELVLHRATRPTLTSAPAEDPGGPIPEDQIAAADRARRAVSDTLEAAATGRAPAPAHIDLRVPVPERPREAFAALAGLLDAAERLARSGDLLVPPGLPEIVAVRDWVCDQAIVQLAGAPPVPWSGADARPETQPPGRLGRPLAAPDWDTRPVFADSRAVVASDDANRILAVSRPLARLIGRTVEDLVGSRIVTIVPPRLRDEHIAGYTRHLAGGAPRILGTAVVLPVLRGDGTELLCELVIEHVRAPDGRSVYTASVQPLDP